MAQRSGAHITWLPALALALGVVSALGAQGPPGPPPPAPVVRLDERAASSRPPQPPAPRPAPAPVTQLDSTGRAALDGAPSVSLAIAQPMEVREILRLLLAATPLSLVFDEQVKGQFEGDLRGLTLRQAVEAVLFPGSLDYDVRGTLLRVFPRRPETRMFDVNRLNVRRTWSRTVRTADGIPPEPTTSMTSAVESEPLRELEAGVRSLLSGQGRVYLDRSAGLVHVTDFADRLGQIDAYLRAVEERASRQVRIEARVLAVTLRDAQAAALDWRAVLARAGAAVVAPAAASGIQVRDLDALLSALADQGTVRTLAAPQLVAANNEPALMVIGTEQVYFEPASRVAESRTLSPAAVLEGLTLSVTAQISSDGLVLLHVAPSYTERTGEARGDGGVTAPVLRVMESDSVVRVRDGHTVVIAGLLDEQTETRKGEGLSGLFGAERQRSMKVELVVLLTPTVVGAGGRVTAGMQ
jgi:MSHA biogenesis protein MshL